VAGRRDRAIGRLVLAAGVATLAAGVAIALAREDADGDDDARVAERERYDAELRRAASRPGRFEVAFAQLPLGDLKRISSARDGRGGYAIVPTEVARRIATGKPPLRPDFGALPHAPELDDFARAFARVGAREQRTDVVALLITQTAPGPVAELSLRVERLDPNDYASIVDATDLVGDWGFSTNERTTRTTQVIRWKPAARAAPMIVPLGLVHRVRLTAETPQEDDEDGGWSALVSHAVLSARELSVRQQDGRVTRLAIDDVLMSPLFLNVGAD
jgi:hypothetical protein